MLSKFKSALTFYLENLILKDLMELTMALGAEMLKMAGKPNDMKKHLDSGAGLAKFYEMVKA
jgi:thymidine phosphorylase